MTAGLNHLICKGKSGATPARAANPVEALAVRVMALCRISLYFLEDMSIYHPIHVQRCIIAHDPSLCFTNEMKWNAF